MPSYLTGFIVDASTNMPITGAITGASATASVDGGSYSSTGITYTAQGGGSFLIEVADSLLDVAQQITVKVTCTNPGTVTWTSGILGNAFVPIERLATDMNDAESGAVCPIMRARYPSSKLKTLPNGKRVFAGLRIDGDRW